MSFQGFPSFGTEIIVG